MATTNQAKEFITYDDVWFLLKNHQDVGHSLPESVENLWQIQNYPEGRFHLGPTQKLILIKNELARWNSLLSEINGNHAKLLDHRFLIDQPLNGRRYAQENGLSERQLREEQRKAIVNLTNLINQEEAKFRDDRKHQIALGFSHQEKGPRFGLEALISDLADQLVNNDELIVFTITGMGGIGKTTLSLELIQHLARINAFPNILRVDVEKGEITRVDFLRMLGRKLFPQKRQEINELDLNSLTERISDRLQKFSHLIYIDGVEEGLDELIDEILKLSNRSKFLISTRPIPASRLPVFSIRVPELNQKLAFELFSSEIMVVHRAQQEVSIDPDSFHTLYTKIGGNPLAIKLVATLTEKMLLQDILKELRSVKQGNTAGMYQRLYTRIWDNLDQLGRNILICLALFVENRVTQETLFLLNRPIGDEQPSVTLQQIQEKLSFLQTRSLIESQIAIATHADAFRYNIHNITREFLNSSVIAWPSTMRPISSDQTGAFSPLKFIENGIDQRIESSHLLNDDSRTETEIIQDIQSIAELVGLALHWPQTRKRALDLLQAVWHALYRRGFFANLSSYLSTAIDFLSNSLEDTVLKIELKNRLGQIERHQRNFESAFKYHSDALKQALLLEDQPHLKAITYWNISETHLLKEELSLAKDQAQLGLTFADTSTYSKANLTNQLGLICLEENNFGEARQFFEQAIEIQKVLNQPLNLARFLKNFSFASLLLNDLEVADQYIEQALSLVSNLRVETLDYLNLRVQIALKSGDFPFALEHCEKALQDDLLQQSKNKQLIANLVSNKGYALLKLDRNLEAVKIFRQAIDLWDELDRRLNLALAQELLGDALIAEGEMEAGMRWYERALEQEAHYPNETELWSRLKEELERLKKEQNLDT